MNEQIMTQLGFSEEVALVKKQICPTCRKPIHAASFRDSLSRKEYGISGMCQTCQDKIFGIACQGADYYKFTNQEEYILFYLKKGYVIFVVTSPRLLALDFDNPDTEPTAFYLQYTTPNTEVLKTRSKTGNQHFYANSGRDFTWPEKAVEQFTYGSDPKRELNTLKRRLNNEPLAELMCEIPNPEVIKTLNTYQSQGYGFLITSVDDLHFYLSSDQFRVRTGGKNA